MQKMLCDAFLFKNVICVINSRMCLALECLTLFLLSLFNWERKSSETQMGPYIPHENFLSQRKGRQKTIWGRFSLGGFVGGRERGEVCILWFQWGGSVPDRMEHWRRFISSRGGKEHIVGGYEKQYFRAGWVMGCYLFRGLEKAYWKQFISWAGGQVCSGIVLSGSILERMTWSHEWRSEAGHRWGNPLGERWEESIDRR